MAPAVSMRGVLALAALAGVLGAAWLGWRVGRDTLEVERLRFEKAAVAHLGLLRIHLHGRESLARAVAATFPPPPEPDGAALAGLDPRFLRMLPDITSFVWVPKVPAGGVPAAMEALRRADQPAPALLGLGPAPLADQSPPRPAFPVLDILPRTEANRRSLGLDLAVLPVPRAALAEAERRADVTATAPLELVQLPGESALVLYAPVMTRGEAPRVAGFLGFSWRHARLLEAAAAPGAALPVTVALRDGATLLFRDGPAEGPPPLRQEISFAGRDWTAEYWPDTPPERIALWRGASVAAVAALLILSAVGLAAWMGVATRRLEAALAGRDAAEERLRIVVSELNHRAKNMLAMVQAVVARSFAEDADPARLRAALEARLHALSAATALLARAEWRGVRLGEVLAESGLPHAERVALDGPDLLLQPGAAQGVVMLVHELWTNAAKHGALSVPGGRVALGVRAEAGEFRLDWTERGGPPPRLDGAPGFGRQLLERLVPRALGGSATLDAAPDGLRYALRAPAAAVLAPEG